MTDSTETADRAERPDKAERTDEPSPRPIGFVGLGGMGSAIATHLLETGHPVVVWNRSAAAVDQLVEAGATRAESIGDAIATGTVFSMLSNESVVFDLFDADVLARAPEGAVHVNMATVGASAATRLTALHQEHGVGYVAAPVLGRPPVAARGELTVLVAGDADEVARVRPVLESIGRKVWDFGTDPSAANVVKIGVNFLIIHALQAMAESITMLEKRDIDTQRFVELLGDSLFPGVVYSGYGKAIASSTYSPPGFTTELGFKDLMLALDAAHSTGVSFPSENALRSVFESALSAGQENLDWASIAEVTRRRSS